jgi:hypothetical protein
MIGVTKNTGAKLLVDVGAACEEYQDRAFRNRGCRGIQADEIKNVPQEKQGKGGIGGSWTAIDADSKLAPCWMPGGRCISRTTIL